MPAIDRSTCPSATDAVELLPSGPLRTAATMTMFGFFLLFAMYTTSPTRLMKILLKNLRATDELYSTTFGDVLHNVSQTNPDRGLALRFLELRDTAAAMHVQTLEHGISATWWWWNELYACCTGLSFKILQCSGDLECLGNEIQLRAHQRANDFTAELARGNSAMVRSALRNRVDARRSYD